MKTELILSHKNLMILGILDEVYDLFQACCDSIENDYREYKIDHPNALLKNYNDFCKRAIDDFLNRHISLFSFRYQGISINNELLISLQMYNVTKTKPLQLRYSRSFQVFLESLENITIKACLYKQRKELPNISFECVKSEVRNHILTIVRQRERKNTEKCEIVPQNDSHTIWIYRNIQTMKCLQEHHSLNFQTARVFSLDRPACIDLAVRYCEDCNKYFISEQTLKAFESEYGLLLSRKAYCQDKNKKIEDEFLGFCNESELHSRGYNVKENGMSEIVRRKFLVDLISKKIMSVEEIIRDIENAIRIFEKRDSFFFALKKWKADLFFLNEFCKRGSPINGELKYH